MYCRCSDSVGGGGNAKPASHSGHVPQTPRSACRIRHRRPGRAACLWPQWSYTPRSSQRKTEVADDGLASTGSRPGRKSPFASIALAQSPPWAGRLPTWMWEDGVKGMRVPSAKA
jgi:hypothetical protein